MDGSTVSSFQATPEAPTAQFESLLQGLVQANQYLLTEPDLALAIALALECLGQAAEADHGYVYQYVVAPETPTAGTSGPRLELDSDHGAGATLSLQGEWRSPSCSSFGLPSLTDEAFLGVDGERLRAGEVVQGQSRGNQGEDRGETAAVSLWVPVLVEGQLWGVLGVSRYTPNRMWAPAEITLFQGVVTSLGGAIARQQAIENLQASERRLKKVSDNVPGMLYQCVLTPAGKLVFTYVSDACQDIMGLTPETMDISLNYVHPEDMAGLVAAIQTSAETLEPFEHSWRIYTPAGESKWLQGSSRPERQPDGSVMWDGVVLDVTQRKRFDARLQESYNLLNSVINGTADLIFIKDREGRYLLANEALKTVLAPGLDSLVGETDQILYPSEVATGIQETDRRVMAQGTAQTFEQTVPIGSDPRTFLVTKTPYFNKAGEVQGVIGISRDVTDLQRVRAERDRFFQLSRDLICIVGFDGYLKRINPAFTRVLGYTEAELLAVPVSEFIHPEDWHTTSEAFEGITDGQSLGAFESRWRCADDSYRWLSWSAATYFEDAIVYATARDITEKKEAAEKLRLQEQFLRSIYDGVEDAIFVLDVRPDGQAVYSSYNRKAETLTGTSTPEVAGKLPEELFGPEGGREVQQRCQQCIATGTSITTEENLIFQGQQTWRLTTFNPLKDGEGKVHRIVGTSIDISGLKSAQAELGQRARLSQFRAEIDSILTRGEALKPMLHRCTEVIVEYMDAAFARIWLLNPGEQVLELQASAGLYTHIDGAHGRVPVGQLKIGLIAQEHQPHITNDVCNDPRVGDREWAQREGMVAFAGYPLIVDGDLLGVVALFAQQFLEGSTVETLGLVADELALGIKRKQTEEQLQASETVLRARALELQQALQDLQKAQAQLVQSEKMSSLGQLVAGVAHEINNPVNFIYGNLSYANQYIQDLLGVIEVYRTHYPEPVAAVEAAVAAVDLPFLMDDLPKLLNSMRVGAERIQDIVSSLRVFSRKDEAERKAIDLHQGIDSTLMILQSRIRAHGAYQEVIIHQDYGDVPLVDCYGGPLNQVFMNVLSNALDALEEQRCAPEAPEPTVTIQTRCHGDHHVMIRISDNGPGIPPAARDRLFDPFYTTKPIGKGTGMGLSISYQIITDKHGGTLTCESEVGQGTTFVITIPLTQPRDLLA